jgi:hypothetical protein
MRRWVAGLQLEGEQLGPRGCLVLNGGALRPAAGDAEPQLRQQPVIEPREHFLGAVVLSVSGELLGDALPEQSLVSRAHGERVLEEIVEVGGDAVQHASVEIR